ncbi:DNA primase, partial [Streptomyces sp. ISL-10]|nr:DNA primase [Streptomyces sp. ISL-10]
MRSARILLASAVATAALSISGPAYAVMTADDWSKDEHSSSSSDKKDDYSDKKDDYSSDKKDDY